jgi:hypothetical protein
MPFTANVVKVMIASPGDVDLESVRLSNAPVVRLGLVVDLSYERSGIST